MTGATKTSAGRACKSTAAVTAYFAIAWRAAEIATFVVLMVAFLVLVVAGVVVMVGVIVVVVVVVVVAVIAVSVEIGELNK